MENQNQTSEMKKRGRTVTAEQREDLRALALGREQARCEAREKKLAQEREAQAAVSSTTDAPVDLPRIWALAQSPSNTLSGIAAATGSTPEKIAEAVKLKTELDWLAYKQRAEEAGATLVNSAILTRAQAGDVKGVEVLRGATGEPDPLSAEDRRDLARARKARTMSNQELEAECARLQKVIDSARPGPGLPGTWDVTDAPQNPVRGEQGPDPGD